MDNVPLTTRHAIMVRRNGGRAMNNLKNLAGNDVSLFLFRFVLRGNGIDFVLNEAIAEIGSACRETPLRVRRCLLASLLPLYRSHFIVLHNLVFFYSHRLVCTTSRINLF